MRMLLTDQYMSSDYPVIVEGGEGNIRSLDVPHVDGGVHHHGRAAATSFLVCPQVRQTDKFLD